MIPKKFAVYILTNSRKTVLYVGMTSNLKQRTWRHKEHYQGFTAKYNVNNLVYYEFHQDSKTARKREKQLKNLLRRKKETLINESNPGWKDLYEQVDGES